MSLQQSFQDQFLLLCEGGFIAVNQFDEDAAQKLFKAASLLQPANMLPVIGRGYIHLCKMELKQACQVFEDTLKKEPNNEMAKAFLGLSLSLNPENISKGEAILEQAKGAKDPMVKKMATSAIEFVNKFVKKTPSPAAVQKKK